LKSGIEDQQLVELVIGLRNQDRLCLVTQDGEEREREPQILCSLGLFGE